jgi:hypothetical protein
MAQNSVYTTRLFPSLLFGAIGTYTLRIPLQQREAKLKSIFLDWQAFVTATNFPSPAADHFIQLGIGTGNDVIARTMEVGGVVPFVTGQNFFIYRPSQVFFNSFYVSNQLEMSVTVRNASLVNCYYNISVVVELIDKIIQ